MTAKIGKTGIITEDQYVWILCLNKARPSAFYMVIVLTILYL